MYKTTWDILGETTIFLISHLFKKKKISIPCTFFCCPFFHWHWIWLTIEHTKLSLTNNICDFCRLSLFGGGGFCCWCVVVFFSFNFVLRDVWGPFYNMNWKTQTLKINLRLVLLGLDYGLKCISKTMIISKDRLEVYNLGHVYFDLLAHLPQLLHRCAASTYNLHHATTAMKILQLSSLFQSLKESYYSFTIFKKCRLQQIGCEGDTNSFQIDLFKAQVIQNSKLLFWKTFTTTCI